MAWLPGYLYRKPLVLTGGASGGQTDFQLDIDIAHVAAKMQADFDDIRFTQNNGTTLIDAWLESKVDSASAKTWAEFPTTPANTVEQTYYMYYGNAGAASDWDIGATFPTLSDDFEDNDVTDWSGSTMAIESAIVKSGTYSGKATGTSEAGPYKTGVSRTSDYIIEFDYRQPGTGLRYLAIGKDEIFGSNSVFLKMDGGVLYYYDGSYHSIKNPFNSDQWYKFKILVHFTANTFDIWLDGNSLGAGLSTRGAISEHNNLHPLANTQIEYIDNIFVRKYAANPPTYTFGSEESAPTGAAPMGVLTGCFGRPFGGII